MLRDNIARRRMIGAILHGLFLACTLAGVIFLVILLWQATAPGWSHLNWDFLNNFPSRRPSQAGIKAALAGSLYMIAITILLSVPIGVAAAIYLEEYQKKGFVNTLIEINIANLAGVPSIIYGLLGLGLFVRWMALDRSVISGALTMTILVLPVIIIAAREALRAVPDSLRQAAFALGATRWQTVQHHVLPAALPGILTGVILSISRALGETAPLITIGALTYVAFVPTKLTDGFTVLPIQIFNWASRPQKEFLEVASAGIIVLLAVLLLLNSVAILIRHKFEGGKKW
ncbi:MAG: phosphate ABC transporter permease PstA [bacterium]|jgi:phosphate transport system permease protein